MRELDIAIEALQIIAGEIKRPSQHLLESDVARIALEGIRKSNVDYKIHKTTDTWIKTKYVDFKEVAAWKFRTYTEAIRHKE